MHLNAIWEGPKVHDCVIFLCSTKVHGQLLLHVAEKQEKQKRGVKSRQVDPNVVAVTFDTLSGPSGVHTGDVVVCTNHQCTAVLSHLSKLTGESTTGQMVSHSHVARQWIGLHHIRSLAIPTLFTSDTTYHLVVVARIFP